VYLLKNVWFDILDLGKIFLIFTDNRQAFFFEFIISGNLCIRDLPNAILVLERVVRCNSRNSCRKKNSSNFLILEFDHERMILDHT